jgi:hypothetical protein
MRQKACSNRRDEGRQHGIGRHHAAGSLGGTLPYASIGCGKPFPKKVDLTDAMIAPRLL